MKLATVCVAMADLYWDMLACGTRTAVERGLVVV